MEKKKLQSVSIAALIVSILPLAALAPIASAPFAVGWSPNRLGRSQCRFCPAGSDSFGGMCAEQGKPQHYQYCINCNQRFLAAADGGNCCACHVPYFRSVRKRLCVELGNLLDAT